MSHAPSMMWLMFDLGDTRSEQLPPPRSATMDWASFLLVLSATLFHSARAHYFNFRGPTDYCKEQTQRLFGNCTVSFY